MSLISIVDLFVDFFFIFRQEALRLKEEEARALEKQLGKKKAREEAEKKFQQRIDDFERQEQEQEHREREKIESNNEQIRNAQFKEDQPVIYIFMLWKEFKWKLNF